MRTSITCYSAPRLVNIWVLTIQFYVLFTSSGEPSEYDDLREAACRSVVVRSLANEEENTNLCAQNWILQIYFTEEVLNFLKYWTITFFFSEKYRVSSRIVYLSKNSKAATGSTRRWENHHSDIRQRRLRGELEWRSAKYGSQSISTTHITTKVGPTRLTSGVTQHDCKCKHGTISPTHKSSGELQRVISDSYWL